MKNKNLVLVLSISVAMLLALLIAGGVVWWRAQSRAPATGQAAASAPASAAETASHDKTKYKYVSLEKIIVMLRGKDGEPVSHYLAMDLVFKAREENEKAVKEHLPLLRSVAVKSLSSYTMDKAGMMSIDQFTADINHAFADKYKREQTEKPFSEAMISKLIIE